MFNSVNFLPRIYKKNIVPRLHVLQTIRGINFSHDNEWAPKIAVLEAVKEKIRENGGFSEKFKTQVCMSMIFQGYATNASLLHAILDLGFPPYLLYVATKPHTTNTEMRAYFRALAEHYGIHYFDFCAYSYQFDGIKRSFIPGTYPAGYYYQAVSQYYKQMIEAQGRDLLSIKRYSEVEFLALFDEGGIYEQELGKDKERFQKYRVVALGHSTSDLSGKNNETLSYPKISMGGAAIKAVIESEEIARANLLRLQQALAALPDIKQETIRMGVLGCGNIGQHVIRELLEKGNHVFYSDIDSGQYKKLRSLSEKYPTRLSQANNTFDLFQNSDIILSCVGQDVTNTIHYSQIRSREESPLKHKLFFNFASGEREFGTWIRESQDKENPIIVDPNKGFFPDYLIRTDESTELVIMFAGMPTNLIKNAIHGLPPELAQIIRGMKLEGVYQIDHLIQDISAITPERLKEMGYLDNYIKLDAWWQRFILKEYFQDLEKYYPENKEKYSAHLNTWDIHTIEKLSNGVVQASLSAHNTTRNKSIMWDSIICNEFYVQREKEKNEIDDCFLDPYHNARCFTLHGIAGIGKTQIAKHYFLANCHKYAIAFYFDAEHIDILVKQYAERLKKYDNPATFNDNADIVNCFIQWIEQHPSSLLVYDNVENHAALETMLPSIGRHRILITSRSENGFNRAAVSSMNAEDANSLLERILKNGLYKGNDLNKIPALAKKLYHFPLAIAQAGTLIVNTKRMTVDQYFEEIEANRKAFINSKAQLPWMAASHESMYMTWLNTKSRLKWHILPWGKTVLESICFLSAEEFSYAMLKDDIAKRIKFLYLSKDFDSFHAILNCAFTMGFMGSYYLLCSQILFHEPSAIEIIFFINFFYVTNLYYENHGLFISKHLFQAVNYFKSSMINRKIDDMINDLVKLGVISSKTQIDYCVHRLAQEIIHYDINVSGIENVICNIDTFNIKLKLLSESNSDEIDNMQHALIMAKSLPMIDNAIKKILNERSGEYVFNDTAFIFGVHGESIMTSNERLDGKKIFHALIEKYISFLFYFMKLLIDSNNKNDSKMILEKLTSLVCEFYESLITSDKVIFFDYILQLKKLISHIDAIMNLPDSKHSIKEIMLPKFKYIGIDYLPNFKWALNDYVKKSEKALHENRGNFFQSLKLKKQIDEAQWLIENCPIPSSPAKYLIYNIDKETARRLYHDNFWKKNPALIDIVEKHYSLLSAPADEAARLSEEWWLRQKNVRKSSPFEFSKC